MLDIIGALSYLGYDQADAKITQIVADQLEESKSFLQGAVGADIFELMPEDPRIDILLKAYLKDLHDNHGITHAKAGNAKREMIHSTEWQLRLELSRKREELAEVSE